MMHPERSRDQVAVVGSLAGLGGERLAGRNWILRYAGSASKLDVYIDVFRGLGLSRTGRMTFFLNFV